ncbi:MAG: FkbM family methyltransferase [Cyanobacteriota bacterium]|nr:FkbM family methyltransferase [Cyanobacteriota bacterium]
MLKETLLNSLADLVASNANAERILCGFCANSFARDRLKLSAIAYRYISKLDQPKFRIAQLDGYKMWVNIAEYQGLFLYFFRQQLEPASTKLASLLLHPGDTCIDAGANLGSYTFLMASRVGDRGRVYAFEPQPKLYKTLLDSIDLNGFNKIIIPDSRALSDRSGQTLKIYLSEDIRNSGISSKIRYGDFLDENCFIETQTVALNDYWKEQQIEQCHLLKIDVEGAERDVLQGAIDLLKNQRIHYLLVEQAAHSEAHRILNSCGYRGWKINELNQTLTPEQNVERGSFGNHLFVSPARIKSFTNCCSQWLKTSTQIPLSTS